MVYKIFVHNGLKGAPVPKTLENKRSVNCQIHAWSLIIKGEKLKLQISILFASNEEKLMF